MIWCLMSIDCSSSVADGFEQATSGKRNQKSLSMLDGKKDMRNCRRKKYKERNNSDRQRGCKIAENVCGHLVGFEKTG